MDGKWLGTLIPFYVGMMSTVVGLLGIVWKGIFSNQQGN